MKVVERHCPRASRVVDLVEKAGIACAFDLARQTRSPRLTARQLGEPSSSRQRQYRPDQNLRSIYHLETEIPHCRDELKLVDQTLKLYAPSSIDPTTSFE